MSSKSTDNLQQNREKILYQQWTCFRVSFSKKRKTTKNKSSASFFAQNHFESFSVEQHACLTQAELSIAGLINNQCLSVTAELLLMLVSFCSPETWRNLRWRQYSTRTHYLIAQLTLSKIPRPWLCSTSQQTQTHNYLNTKYCNSHKSILHLHRKIYIYIKFCCICDAFLIVKRVTYWWAYTREAQIERYLKPQTFIRTTFQQLNIIQNGCMWVCTKKILPPLSPRPFPNNTKDFSKLSSQENCISTKRVFFLNHMGFHNHYH